MFLLNNINWKLNDIIDIDLFMINNIKYSSYTYFS